MLAKDIFDRAYITGRFRLRSSAISSEYFDKYRFEADPCILRRIAERMAALVPAGTEALAGLEMGGIPIATMLSQVTGLPALFIRSGSRRRRESDAILGKAEIGLDGIAFRSILRQFDHGQRPQGAVMSMRLERALFQQPHSRASNAQYGRGREMQPRPNCHWYQYHDPIVDIRFAVMHASGPIKINTIPIGIGVTKLPGG